MFFRFFFPLLKVHWLADCSLCRDSSEDLIRQFLAPVKLSSPEDTTAVISISNSSVSQTAIASHLTVSQFSCKKGVLLLQVIAYMYVEICMYSVSNILVLQCTFHPNIQFSWMDLVLIMSETDNLPQINGKRLDSRQFRGNFNDLPNSRCF